MERDNRLRHTGYATFFLSGICSISSGIIVSLLQDWHGFSFGVTGMLLSCMNIGNMAAAFLAGILPGKIGLKRTALILSAGYALGYALNAFSGFVPLLFLAFLLMGLAKGGVLNVDSVLVGTHTRDRKISMQLMHACYATGALLCPFLVSALTGVHHVMPMLGISACGIALWMVYALAPLPDDTKKQAGNGNRAFLRDPVFWLLTLLMFCQNGAEYGVTGWLVTYYKNLGILTGTLSAYTMTVMWGATLLARLLIAFVIPIRRPFRALACMGLGCTALYTLLICLRAPVPVTVMLFLFSMAMAGVNPLTVATVGSSLTSESMAVMLPIGGIGGIVMPMVIGAVADRFGLPAGMFCNLVPCAGILVISLIMMGRTGKERTDSAREQDKSRET